MSEFQLAQTSVSGEVEALSRRHPLWRDISVQLTFRYLNIFGCKSVCMDRPALGKVGNVSLRYQTSWRVFLFGAIRSRNYRKMAFPCSAISIFLCDFTGKIPQTCIKYHHATSQSSGVVSWGPWVPPLPLVCALGTTNRPPGFWGLHETGKLR